MKQEAIKAVLIASIVLCWIVIGMNLYSMTVDSSGIQPGLTASDGTGFTAGSKGNILEQLLSDRAAERASPCSRITEEQIWVTDEGVIIDLKDAEWATFTDTNSMDPLIDQGANAIEIIPDSEEEICVGDIASYVPSTGEGTIIHRIVETGYDSEGWYAVFKGDNLSYRDPEKVRFSQIRRVVVAIIY